MNKIAASIGLVALGTTAIQAVESSALNSMQNTKPWSIAASLRGFYDDNIDTAPNGQSSLGYQIAPSFDFGMAGEQTSFNVGYSFSANYYENQPSFQTEKWSYAHVFDGMLSHTFNPRLEMSVTESFSLGQEPDIRRSNGFLDTYTRVSGNNIRNSAGVNLNAEVTQTLGLSVGYNNNYVDYDDSGPGSNSALLDRVEHSFRLDSNWKINAQTTGIVGYEYGQTLYTADELLNQFWSRRSEDRNSRTHILSAGAQHYFNSNLSAMLRIGAQFVDYYNDSSADNTVSPYVSGSLHYAIQAATALDLGVGYRHNPANQTGATAANLVQDTESASVSAALSHEIVRHLVGTLNGSWQRSTYNGGSFDGESQVFYTVGARLAYQFTPNLSAHASYNYDQLDSDVSSAVFNYDRSRIFLGVTATY